MNELDLRCRNCKRFLNIKGVNSMIAMIRCPNQKCKALNKVKIVNSESSLQEVRYKFPADACNA